MEALSLHQGRSQEEADVAVLRIMRFMPIKIPVSLRIEPRVSVGAPIVRPGMRVAVAGTIKAVGFGARLTYRQVQRGTSLPVEEVSSQRIALLHQRTLAIPPRAIDRSSVTGPLPDLWIQFLGGGGSPISAPTHLGRCDQGPFDLSPDLELGLSVDAGVLKTERFDPEAEPMLAIAGEVCIRSGIVARFTLSDPGRSTPDPIGTTAPADVVLFPTGTTIQLPRRILHGPLGRDSWIFFTFLDGTGKATGGECLLGRAHPTVAADTLHMHDPKKWGDYDTRGGS